MAASASPEQRRLTYTTRGLQGTSANGYALGSTTVKRAAVDTSTNKFTIYLTANSTASVQVAWHVFG